jgi:hypothetical protein
MGWTRKSYGSIPGGDKRFLYNVQTAPGVHTASYTVDFGGSFVGDNGAGHEILGFDKSN